MADTPAGKVLGVDLGTRRIGLAISDPERRISVPKEHISAHGAEHDAIAVADLAGQENAARIVVGIPISMSGQRGTMAQWALQFVKQLKRATHLPVDVWDERLSTEQAIAASSKSARRRKGAIDSVAAAFVLQSYLDAHAPSR